MIYGHPFETVDAPARQAAVEGFFSGKPGASDLPEQFHVSYIFYGPRERELGPLPSLPGWRAAFQQGDVTIYAR